MREGETVAAALAPLVEPRTVPTLAIGLLALSAAVPVGLLVHAVNEAFAGNPERAASIVLALFAGLMALPAAIYAATARRAVRIEVLGPVVLATSAVLLAAIYLYRVSWYVFFPADILIWSESDFVNDIIKYRTGYPLYSDPDNNDSFVYVPGSRLVTYLLAWLLAWPTSIPAYRIIQLAYTTLAAGLAALCCQRVLALSGGRDAGAGRRAWAVASVPFLFLAATNWATNPYVHNLHDDALALLVSVAAYCLLLRYVATRSSRVLTLMAVIPALGFMVKQSLAVWAVLYCVHLALFDRPRSIRRAVVFGVTSLSAIGGVVLGGYLLWGDHFTYWIFTVLGSHRVSPLRSFQHVLDGWVYFAGGLLGGLVLLRREPAGALIGPWVIWGLLLGLEAYTSGVAWMLNHMGPGSLIGTIWLVAGLTTVWPLCVGEAGREGWRWLRAGAAVAIVGLLWSGAGMVRVPVKPLSQDAYRYVAEVEREFDGAEAGSVLLDFGSWVYLDKGIVMGDRAATIGERGYSQTTDFSGIRARLERQDYRKILVRNLDSNDFWYDHVLWRKSSGIRRLLRDRYEEVRRIRPASGAGPEVGAYAFPELSVLEPRPSGPRPLAWPVDGT
jgi:hypothetical protein